MADEAGRARSGVGLVVSRGRADGAHVAAIDDLVALSFLPVWRWRLVAEALRSGSSPRDILERQCGERRRTNPDAPSADRLLGRAAAALRRGRDGGVQPLTWEDGRFPAPLLQIVDPPPVLWMRGSAAAFALPAVAIVGARSGSPYALAIAERLAGDLAARGLAVTSGMARGVDAAAPRGGLSATGATIAVFGCGADVIYPAEHDRLAADILRAGAIVSELAPGTRPHPRFFPQRNRVISGLSRAVIVIEAGDKSGSLITARCALDQGRDVLAVPGSVLNGRNRGGHRLLRDGARIVESVDDVLEELGLGGSPDRPASGTAGPGQDDPIVTALPVGELCDLDRISAETGLPAASLLPRLFELELQGVVRRVGGGQFVRI
jgi:DNA processing protein